MGGMNKLSTHKRSQILSMLVEGMSMRSVSRITDASFMTVIKLLVGAGEACAVHHDEHVVNVQASRIQCDEIWAFCYAKQKNVPKAKAAPVGAGDVWTWTALDRDTKLLIAYEVGDRLGATAREFIADLRNRLANRVQLTTDGHKVYLEAVENAFGVDVDFAQIIKIYGNEPGNASQIRYSPGECIGIEKRPVMGKPIEADISTSHVERQNLNMRMGMRRFTRLTNAFSKKMANHMAMVALYTTYYNFVRIHQSLRMTPAMAAGLSTELHDMEWIVSLIDARAPKPSRPKTYRKQISN